MQSAEDIIQQLQLEIEELKAENEQLKSSRKIVQIGRDWEIEFKQLMQDLGFPCQDFTDKHLPYDYVVFNYKVQCKVTLTRTGSADIRTRGSRLPTSNHGVRCRYNVGDFDFLSIKNAHDDVFIVPSSILHDPEVPGSLVSRLHWRIALPYKDQWSLLQDGGQLVCTCQGNMLDIYCPIHGFSK